VLALFERSNNIALSGSVVVVVVIGPSGLVWFCWEREREVSRPFGREL